MKKNNPRFLPVNFGHISDKMNQYRLNLLETNQIGSFQGASFDNRNNYRTRVVSLNCGRFGYASRLSNANGVHHNFQEFTNLIDQLNPRILHLQEFLPQKIGADFLKILNDKGYSTVYIPTVFFDNEDTAGICTAFKGDVQQLKVLPHTSTSFVRVNRILKKFYINAVSYFSILLKLGGVTYVNIHNCAFCNQKTRIQAIKDILVDSDPVSPYYLIGDFNPYGDWINTQPSIVPRNLQFLPSAINVVWNKFLNIGRAEKIFPNQLNQSEINKIWALKSDPINQCFEYLYSPNRYTYLHTIKLGPVSLEIPWKLDMCISNNKLNNCYVRTTSFSDHNTIILP